MYEIARQEDLKYLAWRAQVNVMPIYADVVQEANRRRA